MYRGASAVVSLYIALLMFHAFSRVQGRSVFILNIMVFAWLKKLILKLFSISFSELPHPICVAWKAHIAAIMDKPHLTPF